MQPIYKPRDYRMTYNFDKANNAYSSDAESGYVEHDAFLRPPSSIHKTNSVSNFHNISGVSYDIYGSNTTKLTTRYDVKSQSSYSLYGSRKSLPTIVTIDPKTLKASKKVRIKNYVLKKLFPDKDSYAKGEYEQQSECVDRSFESKGSRENWSGKCDFFLSCLGYAVGLGAVWRFPYLCYRNGGGAFLIPYFIFLFLAGIPLFFLELNLGQFTSQGAASCWKMAPIFKGLGISMNCASALLCIYYNMIIAYSIYFLLLSFRGTLEWSVCDFAWSSRNCTDDFSNFLISCDQPEVVRDPNGVCYNYSGTAGATPIGWWNMEKRIEFKKPVLPSEDFFNNYVLQKSTTIENGGDIVWQLAACLFASWVITFLCIFKGIKSSGKIVYFTAVFPFVILLILGIFGWTLPGAGKGISYYIYPDMKRLIEPGVWFDAAVQIFFTMSTSYGGLITLASYNEFNRNTFRDTFLLTITNSLTSVFSGFVVFAFIGYLAHATHQNVDKVVTAGPGLAFIIFPFAVSKLAAAPFWSIVFFLMMLTLGLDSQFATVETVITSFIDVFPKLKKRKLTLIITMCTTMFLLGLPYCTRAGQYWIEIMDRFSGGWSILLIGTLECICIGWVYGYKNFRKDIEMMIGKRYSSMNTFWFWIATWCAITPALLIALIVFALVQFQPLHIDNYVFPEWANTIGWLITAFVLSGIVFWAIYMFIDAMFINKRSLMTLITPEKDWGPYKMENKRLATHLTNLAAYHPFIKKIDNV